MFWGGKERNRDTSSPKFLTAEFQLSKNVTGMGAAGVPANSSPTPLFSFD